MSTPANSLNIKFPGIVTFDGVTTFNATTLTNHSVLVGAINNGITSIAPAAVNTVLLGNGPSNDPIFGTVGNASLTNSSITLTAGTGITITGSPVSLGGAATISATAAVPTSFTGDSGTATPVANNINIFGQNAGASPVMDTIAGGASITIEDRSWLTSFVVDPSTTQGTRGTFSTIQAAITAAVAGQNIYIRPGNYVENLTMKAGVDLFAETGAGFTDIVQIRGTITCTYDGRASISGCQLISGDSDGILVSGANATVLTVINCKLSQAASVATHYSLVCSAAAAEVYFFACFGSTNVNGAWFNVSAGLVSVNNVGFSNNGGSTVQNLISNGNFKLFGCSIGTDNTVGTGFTVSGGSLTAISSNISGQVVSTGTGRLSISESRIFTPNAIALTAGGSQSQECFNSVITAGTASAISVGSTLQLTNCTVNSNNTNAITGSGTLSYGGSVFYGSSSLINTTTQVPYVHTNDAVQIKVPGAYPYTTIPQDNVILVDSSAARTIIPLASPTAGQMHRIKDSTGSAGTNNITITPSGHTIDGAVSKVINISFGSVDIVYSGTEWKIL